MKILNEKEQLIKRADEVFRQYQTQKGIAEDLRRQWRDYEERRFYRNAGEARVKELLTKQATSIAESLYEYSVSLRNKANALEE